MTAAGRGRSSSADGLQLVAQPVFHPALPPLRQPLIVTDRLIVRSAPARSSDRQPRSSASPGARRRLHRPEQFGQLRLAPRASGSCCRDRTRSVAAIAAASLGTSGAASAEPIGPEAGPACGSGAAVLGTPSAGSSGRASVAVHCASCMGGAATDGPDGSGDTAAASPVPSCGRGRWMPGAGSSSTADLAGTAVGTGSGAPAAKR